MLKKKKFVIAASFLFAVSTPAMAQYGQAQYDQAQYDQAQYDQVQYDQAQYDQAGQAQYGQAQYAQYDQTDPSRFNDGFPTNVQPGECYSRCLAPAVYEDVEEQIEIAPAMSRTEVIPAEYEWVDEQVVAKEASEKIETIVLG